MERLRKTTPETLIRICAITLGELEAGLRITATTDQQRRDDFAAFIVKDLLPFTVEVGVNTRIYYADILERIWSKHTPDPKYRTEAHLVGQGVDINDVWMFAVAWERNLTLLTQDKMTWIREAVPEVSVECWI
jgi:predicted nucleic acid-binding protein